MELVTGNVRGTARESNLESAQSMYEGDLVEEGVPGSSSVNRNRIIVSEALYKLGDLG